MRKAKDPAETRADRAPRKTTAEPRARTKKKQSARASTTERRVGPRDGTRRRRDAPAPVSRSARTNAAAPALPPEELLARAMRARTPRARGLLARRGLASRAPLDRTIHSMLLRQLYLAHFEQKCFDKARDVGEQTLELGVLPDVAHQDIARAMQALGDIDGAAGHLRLAARISPASRKAFHYWTLGSLYFLAQRFDDAMSAMMRAARWGTTDKPLYQGHLAVVQCASGRRVRGLATLIEKLAGAPAGQGYGRFVLGQMAFYDGRFDEARRYLEAFVGKTSTGRPATAIALDGELVLARETLARLPGA